MVTLAVFVATVALVILKPGGRSEAIWAVLGACALLLLGRVSPREALVVTLAVKGALLFLLALLLLSALVEASGFFEWAALAAARLARGDGRALYRNVFLLGALVTITLSLDTTAVMVTPLVLAFVARLRLEARPFVLACAFVANAASLLLPMSNLTNLLFVEAFDLGFARFAARMLLPQIVALGTTYALCRLRFGGALPRRFDATLLDGVEAPIPHRGYFRASTIVLALVLVGYFAASLVGVAPYAVAFAGVAVLFGCGLAMRRVSLRTLRGLPWGLFPFVIGLLVLVRGLEDLGFARAAATWLERYARGPADAVFVAAAGTAVAANLMNNVPAVLVARAAIAHASGGDPTRYGALLGANIGSSIVPFASLATLITLSAARRRGAAIRDVDVLATGIWMTPLVLVATALTLAVSFR